jgi:hypothetical protein
VERCERRGRRSIGRSDTKIIILIIGVVVLLIVGALKIGIVAMLYGLVMFLYGTMLAIALVLWADRPREEAPPFRPVDPKCGCETGE